MKRCFVACAALAIGMTLWADGAIRVAPEGEVTSLEAAVGKARQMRAAGTTGVIAVSVAPGRYRVTGPIVLGPGDGHLHFFAERPPKDGCAAETVIEGGVDLSPFAPGEKGVWEVSVPRGLDVEQLYVNGSLVPRAQSPNRFWHHMADSVGEGVSPETGEPASLGNRAFYAQTKDFAPLAGKSPDELREVVIHHYHSWSTTHARLLSYDAKTGLVIERPGSCHWDYYLWNSSAPRYRLENFPEALDAPGEWHFNRRTRVLRYLPRPGERIETTRAVVPVAERFIVMQGDRASGKTVDDITFEGIAFVHSAYRMPLDGHISRQAEDEVGAAIEITGGEGIHFRNCRFECLAMHGLLFDSGTRHSSLRHSIVRELGAGAVRIGTFHWHGVSETRERMASHITVDDCILQHGGKLFPGAVGVVTGMAPDITLTHCDIGDFHYSGVSAGWTWGYGPTLVRDNFIAFNHIHHIGWGELSDMGGIYTLGNQAGTRVIGNHIHDVYSYDRQGRGGWGLYTDEGSANILFASNLVHHVKTGCVHQHYGRNNRFENNIFAFSMDNMVQRSRLETHPTMAFARNIFYWDNGTKAYAYRLGSTNDIAAANNLYWSTAGIATNAFFGSDWRTWRASGEDAGSVIADPLFRDAAHGDWRLSPDSPALALGFKPFDWNLAGVRGTVWRAEAAKGTYPDVAFCENPPPCVTGTVAPFETGFELAGQSGKNSPLHFNVACPSGTRAFVRTTAKDPHRGRYALELRDDVLPRTYEPHLFKNFCATSGTVRISFALKLEEKASVTFLLRDYGRKGFTDGAGLTAAKGRIVVGGTTFDAPVGRWVTVTERIDLTRHKWAFAVTPDGGREQVSKLMELPPAFRRISWAGFLSNANEPTGWFLDDFRYEVR